MKSGTGMQCDLPTCRLAGSLLLVVLLTASSSIALAADAKGPTDWRFDAEVYGWAAGIGADLSGSGRARLGFDRLVDDLDMAFMGFFAASKDKWRFAADVIYMAISEKDSATLTVPVGSGIPARASVRAELKAWILDPNVQYRLYETDKLQLGALAGARYLSIEGDVTKEVTSALARIAGEVDRTKRWWDGVVGVSGQYNLTQRWYVPFVVDVGTGDSRLTWQAGAAVGYHFDSVDAVIGYRHLAWDFKGGGSLEDLFVTGPYVGVNVSF
jgi:hypothetical protein